jgi:hyaluronate lyase
VIVDNAGLGVQDIAGGRTFTGTWCGSSGTAQYGSNSLYSCGAGIETYRWTPKITAAAAYDVYVRWTTHVNRSTSVPISVTSPSGTVTQIYNEQVGGGVWTLHGRYDFIAGTTGYVEVTDVNGQANADAVRFVPVTP